MDAALGVAGVRDLASACTGLGLVGGLVATGITVGDGAWIGAGVLVLDGANLGQQAIVGAGAVVTKSVDDFAVVAGVPARFVRSRK